MKNFKAILFLILLISFIICANQNAQTTQTVNNRKTENISINETHVEDIVFKYFELSYEGKMKDLKSIVIRTPQSFHDYRDKRSEKIPNEIKQEEKEKQAKTNPEIFGKDPMKDSPQKIDFSEVIKRMDNSTYKDTIEFFPSFIFDSKVKIEEILSQNVKGNKARIRVKIYSKEVKLTEEILEVDFFLFKNKTKNWKIFRYRLASLNKSETYPN